MGKLHSGTLARYVRQGAVVALVDRVEEMLEETGNAWIRQHSTPW